MTGPRMYMPRIWRRRVRMKNNGQDDMRKKYQKRVRACREFAEVQDTLLCHADVLCRAMRAPDPERDPAAYEEYLRATDRYKATEKRAAAAREAMKKALRA